MSQKPAVIWCFLSSPWKPHALAATLCLLVCVPMLWEGMLPASWGMREILGYLLSGAALCSIVLLVLYLVHTALKLKNAELVLRIITWLGLWGAGFGIFCLLAYVANVPMSVVGADHSGPEEAQIHEARDVLLGEASYHLYYDEWAKPSEKIALTPNISQLEKEHPSIFLRFISESPRWNNTPSVNFYAQAGHLVLTRADDPAGLDSSVHMSFLHLAEGANIPHGYVLTSPGAAFPARSALEGSGKQSIPDLALELGGDHILLLAWRGNPNVSEPKSDINAALSTVDKLFEQLAKNPTEAYIAQQLDKKQSVKGRKAEILLNSPPAQYGCYQAEIYANPQEAGFLTLLAKNAQSGETLLALNWRAHFSADSNELFRYEIPSGLSQWITRRDWSPYTGYIKDDLEMFSFLSDKQHRNIPVQLELWFSPQANAQESGRLLSKQYIIQSYTPNPVEEPEAVSEITESPATPVAPVAPASPKSPPSSPPPVTKQSSPNSSI